MTDDELRKKGQRFIDERKRIWLEHDKVKAALDPMVQLRLDAQWDYVDPLRMGLYLTIKGMDGAFEIDMEQVRKVCLNPQAFKQTPEGERLRAGDFSHTIAPEQQCALPPEEGFASVKKPEQSEGQ